MCVVLCLYVGGGSLPPPYPPQKLRSQFVEKLKENEAEIEELVASFSAQK